MSGRSSGWWDRIAGLFWLVGLVFAIAWHLLYGFRTREEK